MREPQFAIAVRASLDGSPPPLLQLDERITDIRYSSQLPFGWADASVGIAEDVTGRWIAYLPTPVEAPIGGHMQIFASGTLVHEGRIAGRRRDSGVVVGIPSMGYGNAAMRDDWYRGGGSPSTPGHTLAIDVLRTLASTLTIGDDFVGPTTPYDASEFIGRYPIEIIEQMGRGGDDGTPWLFTVYNRVASWFPEIEPTTPDYRIGWRGVKSDEDDSEVYGAASLDVDLPDGTRQTITRTYPGGNARHAHLDAAASSLSAAQTFLDTWLAQHQTPVVSMSFERDKDHWLERADGGRTPPWQIRAGATVQVGDEAARYITKVTYTAKDYRAQIQVGPPPRRTLARVVSDALALYGAVKSGSDLLTAAHVH
jgi:hypothetical protein